MSKEEKLLQRFLSRPKDFTFNELKTLLRHLGYEDVSTGKTRGSRVMFYNEAFHHPIRLHKPHPRNILKPYQVDLVIGELRAKGILK